MSADTVSLLEVLLWTNLRAAALIGLVFGGLKLIGTRAGGLRHSIWIAALAGCLALPVASAVLPALAIPILPAGVAALDSPVGPVEATASFGPASSAPEALSAGQALLTTYLLGVAVALTLFGRSLWRVGRHERAMAEWPGRDIVALKDELCRELGIRRPVALLASGRFDSPSTWGVLRPRVVLPAAASDWPRARMRNALLHELCHVKRYDWLRLCLQRLVVAVYWFNPLVWVAIRQCAYEAERACDDFVLESGGRSADYAEQLVDLMATSRGMRAGISLGDGHFARRVRAILDSGKEVKVMSKKTRRFAVAGVGLAVVLLAACQVTSGRPAAGDVVVNGAAAADEQERREDAEQAFAREFEAEMARERAAYERVAETNEREQAARIQDQARLEVLANDERLLALRQMVEQAQAQQGQQRQERQRILEERMEAYRARLLQTQQGLEYFEAAQGVREGVLSANLDRASVESVAAELQTQRLLVEELRASLEMQRAELMEQERRLAVLRAQIDRVEVEAAVESELDENEPEAE